MGSTRLPGKVLADLGGQPLLAFMLERIGTLPITVVVATSDLGKDDPVAEAADASGVAVIRGPEQDVLARYALALEQYRPDLVVRLTADCPLADPALVSQALEVQVATGATYVSNTLVRTFPDGLDVEVVTAAALRAADTEAVDPDEREHVTPFVYRRPGRFPLRAFRADELLGDERWTVDTAADLAFVRYAVEQVGGQGQWGWRTVLDAVGRRAAGPAPGLLRLRPVVPSDREMILAWRNDHDAVRFSRSGRALSPIEHQAWFDARLDDPSTRLWIGEVDGSAVGQVRVDVDEADGLVSVTVAPNARGQGIAGQLLTELDRVLMSDLQVIHLVAEVHDGNEPSRRLFARAGFVATGRTGCFAVMERPVIRSEPSGHEAPPRTRRR